MQTLKIINIIITVIFILCYSYQFVYIPIALFKKQKKTACTVKAHRYAILISARNEEAVIADLIGSIKKQTYDASMITTFVIADNCTDSTEEAARNAGAVTYRRVNHTLVGKGYALNELLRHIRRDYPDCFDAFIVFDADNYLAPDYVEKMNECFSEGHDVIVSYRNSKNYGDNWISAGYGLWFLRDSRYLNNVRDMIGTSCLVGGTGFLFSSKVEQEMGGWPFHTLVEDLEFSIHEILAGRRIAYCKDAEFYDEQPVKFSQSWKQRLRWCRGYLQVILLYGKQMISGIFKGSFSCFDLTMCIMPAYLLSALSILVNLALGFWGMVIGDNVMIMLQSIGRILRDVYSMLFIIGLITTVTEWKHISEKPAKKILYLFTFPIFMFTYLPISIAALFKKVSWEHIEHKAKMRFIQEPVKQINS